MQLPCREAMLLTGITRLMICARRKLSLPLSPFLCIILIAISVVVSNEDDGAADTPYLFRTYDHHGEPDAVKNPGPAHRHEIWKVARATSAAPTYFSPVIIDDKEYYDGGIGNNNPVMLMLEEVAAKAETKSYDEAMSIVVSIGAGLKPSKRLRAKHKFPRITSLRPLKAISKVLDKLKETSTDSERDHHTVERMFRQIKFDHYYRWNGGGEVGGLALDEWHPNPKGHKPATDKFIEMEVKHYMSQEDIRQEVDKCARKLVKLRRDRAAYRPENGTWRRRTHCTVLRCPYCDILLEDRINLKTHIIQKHPEKLTPQIPIEALVQQMEERPPQFPGGPF
jgi:chorismate mutase